MNYVLTDKASAVVLRSAAPLDAVEGFAVHETEAWPVPGAIRAKNGKFVDPPVLLDTLKARKRRDVMAERDARISGGFTFKGKRYQTRARDRENITAAAQLAHMAVELDGAQPNDLKWRDGVSDFAWIAEDNSLVAMDAQTVRAFGKAAADMKAACIFRARALKDAIDAAPDEKALDAVDVTSGWPA